MEEFCLHNPQKSQKAHCIGINDHAVSIDCVLSCLFCGETIPVWFLVESKNEIYSQIPEIKIIKYSDNRYDVTILVNGLPLVHVELKRRGVDIKDAFNQINRYQNDSFWAGSGLYEFIQIFVISNGTYTKYYSNTTRQTHISDNSNSIPKKGKRTSNSFEFTSWWADRKNRPIIDLIDFAKTFLAKHTLLNILTKYCVFTSDETLMVMRPYQIVATESILNKIKVSSNYKLYLTTINFFSNIICSPTA